MTELERIEDSLSSDDVKQLFLNSYFFMINQKLIDDHQLIQWTNIVRSTLPDHITTEMFDEWIQEAKEAVSYIESKGDQNNDKTTTNDR